MIELVKESEMYDAGIVSLSNRPSSPYAYGGDGLSPTELKERFDRLPRLVAERLNLLIEAVLAQPELSDLSGGSLAEIMLTGLFPNSNLTHTLAEFFRDVLDGSAAAYFKVQDKNLLQALDEKMSRPRLSMGSEEVLLEPDCEIWCGKVGTLKVRLPDDSDYAYTATLVFDTVPDLDGSVIEMPLQVCWSGDDILENTFVPVGGKHYTCVFWFDGAYQAVVRGVSNDA